MSGGETPNGGRADPGSADAGGRSADAGAGTGVGANSAGADPGSTEAGSPKASRRWAGLPRDVWALGLVSLCMDTSSELIFALLPAFVALELGVGTVALGLLEGGAEAVASFTKIISGRLSDRSGRRKPLAVLGYGLSALSKPLFALAPGLGLVVVARGVDRVGKGIRGAPRDALIADVTPPEVRGAAYGLRQALDSVGAVLGPLAAVAWMILSGDRIREAFAVAVIPAVLAVVVLVVAVREPKRHAEASPRAPMRWADIRRLGFGVWSILGLAALLALARLTEAFLILAALERGLSARYSPLALVLMSTVYSLCAFPAGRLADRWPHARLFALGAALLVVAHGALALAPGLTLTFVGVAIYGVHMALSQGLLSAWMADRAPAEARGTAFGMLHFATGIASVGAGLVAGVAWKLGGAPAAFASGAVLAVVATLGGVWVGQRSARP